MLNPHGLSQQSVLIEFLANRAPVGPLRRRQIEPALAKEKDSNGGDLASAYRKASPVLDAVYQMVAAVLVGTLGGWWLDGKVGTKPWLMVAGSVLGIATGLTVFLRAAAGMSGRKAGPGKAREDSQKKKSE